MKYSLVIRVKNEVKTLSLVLKVLKKCYAQYIHEIIIVDNASDDGSRQLGIEYDCKIVSIVDFSYGRAINLGIAAASSDHIILLSAHSLPVGASFFESLSMVLMEGRAIAAARFINSAANYQGAAERDFKVVDPVHLGISAACCYVNKKVWDLIRFDEEIMACEDKLWSKEAIDRGFEIVEIPETFFYFAQRSPNAVLQRSYNETLANHLILGTTPLSPIMAFLIFLKNLFWAIPMEFLKKIGLRYRVFKNQLRMYKTYKSLK